jgi:hypothetical protein
MQHRCSTTTRRGSREVAPWVIEEGTTVCGVAVLMHKQDHLLLKNIAVDPKRQGKVSAAGSSSSLKRKQCGAVTARSVCTRTMIENQRLYAKIGYAEASGGSAAGCDRVFMYKQLRISDRE